MRKRKLGLTEIAVSEIGFGAFKIGRNQDSKYAQHYDLPDLRQVRTLLNAVLDMGINHIDTAPAYGTSEELIGQCLSHRRDEFVLSSKVGEFYENGSSRYDYSPRVVRESIEQSLKKLKTDRLDLVFIHSHGEDLKILRETDVVESLQELKRQGKIRAIGISGKTVEGARESLKWADALMVEYHLSDRSHQSVIAQAQEKGIGVIIKKGLFSGNLDPKQAISFVLKNRGVTNLVIGGLNAEHIRQNISYADENLTESSVS